jgi:hypothetical protein
MAGYTIAQPEGLGETSGGTLKNGALRRFNPLLFTRLGRQVNFFVGQV